MTFYLYEYNNYYNRIIKKQATIDEYNKNGTLLYSLTNTNFIPNDGIYTEHIINYDTDRGDYVVIVDDYTDTISSRWFVIESVRVRAGQYKLTLYRDVIADWYDDIVSAPVFIEKASARIGDPAIYNSENMTYNQIKKSERLLKDKTNIPWIVGYIDRKYEGTSISIPVDSREVGSEYTSLESYPYYQYQSSPLYVRDNITNEIFRFNLYNSGITGGSYVVAVGKDGNPAQPKINIQQDAVTAYYYWRKLEDDKKGYLCPYTFTSGSYVAGEASRVMYDKFKSVKWNNYSYISANFTNIQNISPDSIQAENGKIIKAGSDYYQVSVIEDSAVNLMAEIPTSSALGKAMGTVVEGNDYINLAKGTNPVYEYELTVIPYRFQLTKIYISEFTTQIPTPSGRAHLKDAPYDMFAIPYGEIALFNRNTNSITVKELGMRLAAEIQVTLGEALYDIQLLPYGPFPDSLIDVPSLQRPMMKLGAEEGVVYSPLIDGDDNLGSFIVWLTESNFTKYIDSKINVSSNNIDFKVQNECDMYRLTSPNYNTSFEFSATKNNGVEKFRVDIAYKPVTPYIRVAPLFDGLYGNIIDDTRGLICGGDFSLSQILDKWLEYQRNNKNFQDIFDRQIENLEVKNNVARIQEKWAVATGTISGVTTGALSGGMMGGGYGAIAGAVAGGTASLAGGLADIRLNEKLRTEAIDYTKDQFGYELGNIQAQPTGLTKISTLNPNNKIFPVLEYYTATDVEKEALRNKIKYNGMTIMRIGSMTEFLATDKTYIKGKLIRLEPTDGCDFHVVSTIANELYKGVFI